MHVVAPDQAAQFFENQYQAVGEQHLVEVVALVEVAEQQALQRHAEHHGERDREQDRGRQVAGHSGQRPRQVGADHVEAAMGQVDDAHDAEHQRQPAGDEEQQQAVLQAVEQLDQEKGEIHGKSAVALRR
jgi:hypothetical protein